jgi:acyl transferase domain-containing protein
MEAEDVLSSQYWVENMVNPVFFFQALECALGECGSFDLALEIGPHPALKGPTSQTIQEITRKKVPYIATLNRGKDDLESFLSGLGFVWSWLGTSGIDFVQFLEACHDDGNPGFLLKGLPTYPWNHDRPVWSESRAGKLFRTHESPFHGLLGRRTPDEIDEEWRWQNVLKTREIPWLSGHALQGQTVLPATGYIALAMEASMEIASGRPVDYIELSNLLISKAIAIDDAVGTEILITMSGVTTTDSFIHANFTSYSTVSEDSGKLAVNASGKIHISLGEPSADILPSRSQPNLAMSEVDIDLFYSTFGALGYGYSGPFRAMSTLRRRLGIASGTVDIPPVENDENRLLFHPGMLDISLQGMLAAFSAPGDGRLWSLHVPTSIRRVTLIPSLCGKNLPDKVSFDCTVTELRPNNMTGDADIFTAEGDHKIIEIEGLAFVPFSRATEADDIHMFAETTWGVDRPDGDLLLGDERASATDIKKAYDCERVAFYYLRTLNETIDTKERAEIGISWNHEALFDSAAHAVGLVLNGKHKYAKKEWISDSHEQICAIMDA